MINVMHMVG